jgi:hypothetical protein
VILPPGRGWFLALCVVGLVEWIDNLQLLDNRAGPAVRDDERNALSGFERTWMK